ncbi:alpha/beta hydrolase [Streptosporangium sp. NPDC051022]|uniref:alpha/beta hydrolase n=1 Tax=Streptosporangium sp. NPDC051022 TaxID=3155752 RepID=UPI00343A0296
MTLQFPGSWVPPVAAALTLLSATVVPATASNAATAAAPPSISWRACSGLPVPAPGLECGTLTVPLDHDRPGAGTVDVAVIRAKATGDRLGSLVMNFGGGGNGVVALATGHERYAALRSRYDLVSFDPRGSGGTSRVTCGSDAALDRLFTLGPGIDDPVGRKAYLRGITAFVRDCQKESGRILPHAGMGDVARDMDLLRAALGEGRLDYYGMSLGSVLGGVYATLYPRRVGRMVLDAGLDPRQSIMELEKRLTTAFQLSYERFLEGCVKNGCDLGKDVKAANRAVEGLVERLRRGPLTVGDRRLTADLAITALLGATAQPYWEELELRVAKAVKGDGAPLLEMADALNGRQNGTYLPYAGLAPSMYSSAVYCRDRERPARRDLVRLQAELTRISPLFGLFTPSTAYLVPVCAHWPVPVDPEGRTVGHTGAAPIVVIGSAKDPAAPLSGAASLSGQLTNGVLVTYEGDLHGAYPTGGTCVTGAVEGYLFDGRVPARGVSCPAA